MRRHLVIGAFIAALMIPSPAPAQLVDQDVRCMILSAFFQNGAKEPAQKQVAATSLLYYLGRVSARVPSSSLKSVYLAQAVGLKNENAGLLMNACVKQLQSQELLMNNVRQEIARSLPKQAAPPKK